jgi:hypothetical protein
MSKTSMIVRYLRNRYRLPNYALFFEVVEKISVDSERRADAIAVNLNDGTTIGFEIKASRSDWLRELKQPEKAECFAKQVNEFYIVAPYEVLQFDEIPENYGWLMPGSTKVQKKAVRRDVTVSMDLMTVLLRSAALICEKYERVRGIVESSLYEHVNKESEQ